MNQLGHLSLKHVRVARYVVSVLGKKTLQTAVGLMFINMLLVSLPVAVSAASLKLKKLLNQLGSLPLYVFIFFVASSAQDQS